MTLWLWCCELRFMVRELLTETPPYGAFLGASSTPWNLRHHSAYPSGEFKFSLINNNALPHFTEQKSRLTEHNITFQHWISNVIFVTVTFLSTKKSNLSRPRLQEMLDLGLLLPDWHSRVSICPWWSCSCLVVIFILTAVTGQPWGLQEIKTPWPNGNIKMKNIKRCSYKSVWMGLYQPHLSDIVLFC